MNLLKVPKGASLAVFGTGAVGLAAVMAARIVGATPIIGIDIHPARLELALELGATHVINSRQEDFASAISSITGSGVDFILETSGNSTIYQIAVDALNPAVLSHVPGPMVEDKLPGEKKSVPSDHGQLIPSEVYPSANRFLSGRDFPI
jgi:aryl-alcohol dehydrogenase